MNLNLNILIKCIKKYSPYGFVVTSTLICYGYLFPSSNLTTHIPYIQSLLNPELYKFDFYVQEALQFSPRYYYQSLITSTISLGISLPYTYFIYYIISLASFIFGLYALGNKFGQSKLSAGVLAFLCLSSIEGTIGSVDLFRTEPIPAMFAMGITIWGFYFCFCKKWFFGYLFFGISCLLQFLVGLLPGLMMSIILVKDTRKYHKSWTTVIWPMLTLVFFASLVYIPMKLSNNTGTDIFNSAEFIHIYGYIRHPHHIILSSINPKKWSNFIFFMSAGILFIKSSKTLKSEEKSNFLIIIALSLLSLFLGYVFVEIFPVSLFAKFQLARTTPFAQLMIFIAISALVNKYYKEKNWLITVILILIPTLEIGSIILFIVSVLISTHNLKIKNKTLLLILTVLIFIYFSIIYPSVDFSYTTFKSITWKLLLFISLTFPFILEEFIRPKSIKYLSTFLLSCFSCTLLILGLTKIAPQFFLYSFENKIKIYQVWNNSLTKLAVRFKDKSQQDTLILVPPFEDGFRLHSQRSVVVTFKGFPFTDQGIQEWLNRMTLILGPIEYPISLSTVNSLYSNRSYSDLLRAAQKLRAEYILTKKDWHNQVDGVVFDQEGEWIIYQVDLNQ